MDVEVPFQSLVAMLSVLKGRHFQLKYKSLTVSNRQGVIPVIWKGYHLVDAQTMNAAQRVSDFVTRFKSRQATHYRKLVALTSGPAAFMDLLIELGEYNYETICDRLRTLSGNGDPVTYLLQLREIIRRYPIVTEFWEDFQ
jgi:hypothetical protein